MRPDPKWDAVDWRQTDKTIAHEMGISPQRVHQVRKRFGYERSRMHSRSVIDQRLTLDALNAMRIENHDYHYWQALLKAPRETVGRYLRKLGRRPKKSRLIYAPFKHDWDAVDWRHKYDAQIARELGVARAVVTMARRRQGRPSGPDGRRAQS